VDKLSDFDKYMLENKDCILYDEMAICVTDTSDCEFYDESPICVSDLSDCIIYDEAPIKLKDGEIAEKSNFYESIPTIEDAVCDFRAGCNEAFDYVYRYFKPKIEYMAKSKSLSKAEELIGEINMQLIKCMKTYKFGGVKFNTFFWRCAQNTVGMYFTKLNAQKRINKFGEVSLSIKADSEQKTELGDTIVDDRSADSYNKVLFNQTLEQSIYPLLEEKDVNILKLCIKGIEIGEISKLLNMTKAGIYLRIKKMKNNVALQKPLTELAQLI
jgi:RNA polymerase sigma factor (sigma-70 family)